MTINIFVEIEERMDVETPFNILPASMAYYSNLLSLAVVLPSSPSDLTHYWVRPKHSIGTTPIVNFPYKEDIEKLVTYPPLFRESNLFVLAKS